VASLVPVRAPIWAADSSRTAPFRSRKRRATRCSAGDKFVRAADRRSSKADLAGVEVSDMKER
jgi:hypothetical protein